MNSGESAEPLMNATPAIAPVAPDTKSTRPRAKIHDSPAVGPGERGGRHGKAPLGLFALLAGFIVLQAFLPLGTAVQIGADEGFELAKATLMLHGHGLYTEAWNDQPPLHTFLVVQVLKHLSPGGLGARLVTVIVIADGRWGFRGRFNMDQLAGQGHCCGVSVWGGVADEAGAGGVAAVGGADRLVAKPGRRTIALQPRPNLRKTANRKSQFANQKFEMEVRAG